MKVTEVTGQFDVQIERAPDGSVITRVIIVCGPAEVVTIPLNAEGVSKLISMLKGHKPIEVVPAGAVPITPADVRKG